MMAVKGIYGLIFAVCCIVAHPAIQPRSAYFKECVHEVRKNAESLLKFYEKEAQMSAAVLQQYGRGLEALEKFLKLPSCTFSEKPTHQDIKKVLNAFKEHFKNMDLILARTELESLKYNVSLAMERLNCPPKALPALPSPPPPPKTNLPNSIWNLPLIERKEAVYYALEFYKNCTTALSSQV